ncbi:hypothetical protein PH203_27270 [Streptomyces sp. S.PB5]|nr:hypothetical protein [Streptomyces sp. S.PB5]
MRPSPGWGALLLGAVLLRCRFANVPATPTSRLNSPMSVGSWRTRHV